MLHDQGLIVLGSVSPIQGSINESRYLQLMPSLGSILDEDHLERLSWFETHQGETTSWPAPPKDGQFLATKAKGIYKPVGFHYALSIRVSQGGPYVDTPEHFNDGSWQLSYHEETRANQPQPAKHSTNIGLTKCLEDKIPVGVMVQKSSKPNVAYKILGLGLVTAYAHGRFIVEGPVSLDNAQTNQAERSRSTLSPADVSKDDRDRIFAEVVRRQGQGAFRKALLMAYHSRCAVTGCTFPSVLEAAHILPHRGNASNQVQNGLLLRADIHTLFDLGLLRIDPSNLSVRLHDDLRTDPDYGMLYGRTLQLPTNTDDYPSPDLLTAKNKLFEA